MCYNLPSDFMILDIIHGHIEEIVCGKSGLALSHEIRDMEEYVTNLSGEQNLEYIQDVRDVLTQVQKVWGKYE